MLCKQIQSKLMQFYYRTHISIYQYLPINNTLFSYSLNVKVKWTTYFRLKNFCGVIAESVVSKTNKLHVRFFAEKHAVNSKFTILYTAYRPKVKGEGKYGKYFYLFFE